MKNLNIKIKGVRKVESIHTLLREFMKGYSQEDVDRYDIEHKVAQGETAIDYLHKQVREIGIDIGIAEAVRLITIKIVNEIAGTDSEEAIDKIDKMLEILDFEA